MHPWLLWEIPTTACCFSAGDVQRSILWDRTHTKIWGIPSESCLWKTLSLNSIKKKYFEVQKKKVKGFFYTFSEKNKFKIMKFYLSTLLLDDDLFFRSRLKIGRKFKGLLKKTNVTRFKLAHNNYFNNLSFDNHVFKTD